MTPRNEALLWLFGKAASTAISRQERKATEDLAKRISEQKSSFLTEPREPSGKTDLQKPSKKKTSLEKQPPQVIDGGALADFFKAEKWIGKTGEMERTWRKVPYALKKNFDFGAEITKARQETLKRRKGFTLKKKFSPDVSQDGF